MTIEKIQSILFVIGGTLVTLALYDIVKALRSHKK